MPFVGSVVVCLKLVFEYQADIVHTFLYDVVGGELFLGSRGYLPQIVFGEMRVVLLLGVFFFLPFFTFGGFL